VLGQKVKLLFLNWEHLVKLMYKRHRNQEILRLLKHHQWFQSLVLLRYFLLHSAPIDVLSLIGCFELPVVEN